MKRFIWSCTRFLAGLLCVAFAFLCWQAGDNLMVLIGWALLIGGPFYAVQVYRTQIAPMLEQEKSENKE